MYEPDMMLMSHAKIAAKISLSLQTEPQKKEKKPLHNQLQEKIRS